MTAMNPPDEFLKRAAECQQMAKVTRDPASKATWNRMAERWLRCAERSNSSSVAAPHEMPAWRRPIRGSAHPF
jgi:hypothetical protein